MSSVGHDVEHALQGHASIATKLIEAVHTASLPPTALTSSRLRTVQELVNRFLDTDRNLMHSINLLWTHQIHNQRYLQIRKDIEAKQSRVLFYASALRKAQESIENVLEKHRYVIDQYQKRVLLDPQAIVAYAHRIAGTTSAPAHWQPGLPMFGFMPPAPQEHMMRAGVLSRGIIAETVTREEGYSFTVHKSNEIGLDQKEELKVPIQLGASDAEIRNQMPEGWKPGDPVDLPLDALAHHLGRSYFQEQNIPLPENWRMGDPIPSNSMDLLRKKFNLPLEESEMAQKKRKIDSEPAEEAVSANESSEDSDDSDSDHEMSNAVNLSMSSSSEEEEEE